MACGPTRPAAGSSSTSTPRASTPRPPPTPPPTPLTPPPRTLHHVSGHHIHPPALSVGASGTYRNLSTGSLTLGGNVTNSGTIVLNSNGTTCGDADSILIRSTAASQRSWSGSGSFWLQDVDLQYQSTTLGLTVYSGTNSGNNTGFTFSSSCYRQPLSYRKSITIDHTKVGNSGAPTTLSNFPMLYSVTDTALKTTANGGHVTNSSGYDIIFRALDTTTCGGPSNCTLDHEIEKYTATTGELVAWVRLPSVNAYSASSNTVIYIYYGNSSITTSTQNATGVWDSNFKGVWHLKETTGGSGAIKDSTSNANNGTDTNSPTLGAAGQIGNAISFNGTNNYLDAGNLASLQFTGNITLSAWIKPTSLSDYKFYLSKYDYNDTGYDLGVMANGSVAATFRNLAHNDGFSSTGLIHAGSWQHVVVVQNSSNCYASFYINGAFDSTLTNQYCFSNPSTNFQIGSRAAAIFFPGSIDEVRISNITRSADWIKAEYNNQSSPSTFYTVGAEVNVGVADPRRSHRG